MLVKLLKFVIEDATSFMCAPVEGCGGTTELVSLSGLTACDVRSLPGYYEGLSLTKF